MKNPNTLAELMKTEISDDIRAFALFKFKDESVEFEVKSENFIGCYEFTSNLSSTDIDRLFDNEINFRHTRAIIAEFLQAVNVRFEDDLLN